MNMHRKLALQNPDILRSTLPLPVILITSSTINNNLYVDPNSAKSPIEILSHLISEFKCQGHLSGTLYRQAVNCHFGVDYTWAHRWVWRVRASSSVLCVTDRYRVIKIAHIVTNNVPLSMRRLRPSSAMRAYGQHLWSNALVFKFAWSFFFFWPYFIVYIYQW